MQVEQSELITVVFVVALTIGLLVSFFILIILRNFRVNSNRKIELYKSVIQTQELERDRIGRNLHDELGGLLSSIKINMDNMIDAKMDVDFEIQKIEIHGQIDQALREIRKIVYDMVPTRLQQAGLPESINKLTEMTSAYSHIQCHFSLVGDPLPRFQKSVEMNLYRIIQELINNTIKHAKASEINIQFESKNDVLFLSYTDDGKGFDTAAASSGMGLQNLKTRVSLYNGSVQVQSSEKDGTAYTFTFNLHNLPV